MGGDGGSIPQRVDLVRNKKKTEKMDRAFELVLKWRLCALTQQPLKHPIVVCGLGKLYIKEALIEALLNKTIGESESAKHIHSLKDVRDAIMTPNPAFNPHSEEKGGTYQDKNMAEFICPIVGLEMNGIHRFCILLSCGHVMSEKAMKQVVTKSCLVCGKAFCDDDILVINGTDEEQTAYMERIVARRAAAKASKKSKHNEKKIELTRVHDAASTSTSEPITRTVDAQNEPIQSSSSSSTTATQHKRKSTTAVAKDNGDVKKAKPTIQQDAASSSVYKSIFTSSEECKKQPRAHWVTYNPLYY